MSATFDVLRGALPEDIREETVEEVRRLTSATRHRERMEVVIAAARSWLAKYEHETSLFDACALLICEGGGLYGGGTSTPGAGSTRHHAFRSLGSGISHTGDLWEDAIRGAPKFLEWNNGISP
jgi:hypothetical protein